MKNTISRFRKQNIIILAAVALVALFAAFAQAQETKTFFSDALGAEKEYRIYLPASYETQTDKQYPVVILLHGYNFARNNPDLAPTIEEQNHWISQEQVPEIAGCLSSTADYNALLSCLETAGVEYPDAVVENMQEEYPDPPLPLPEMIVIMPDGDSSFYLDRKDGIPTWPPLDGPEFVNGIRKGATGQYETYIYNDLVKHVDSTYRTLAERDKRGIGGFSMGGIGSMNILLGHPDVFISVSAMSAMFTLTDFLNNPLAQGMEKTTPEIRSIFGTDPNNFKSKIDVDFLKKSDPYYRLRDLDRDDVFIYYDAGSADFFSGMNNFKTFDKFAKGLDKKGLKSYPSKHIIPASEKNGKGMHTGAYWRSRMGVVLAFHAMAFDILEK